MKKLFYFLVTLIFSTTACNKKNTQEQMVDPASENTMLRTFSYPNRGTTATITHETSDVVGTASCYSEGMSLYFNAATKLIGSAGDAIGFILNKSQLKVGYVGVYDINPSSSMMVRYAYSYFPNNGGGWNNLLNSWDGVKFEGRLIIDTYDERRNLINGSYNLQIKDLTDDPAKEGSGSTDPNDKCNIALSGTFANLKIKFN